MSIEMETYPFGRDTQPLHDDGKAADMNEVLTFILFSKIILI